MLVGAQNDPCGLKTYVCSASGGYLSIIMSISNPLQLLLRATPATTRLKLTNFIRAVSTGVLFRLSVSGTDVQNPQGTDFQSVSRVEAPASPFIIRTISPGNDLTSEKNIRNGLMRADGYINDQFRGVVGRCCPRQQLQGVADSS